MYISIGKSRLLASFVYKMATVRVCVCLYGTMYIHVRLALFLSFSVNCKVTRMHEFACIHFFFTEREKSFFSLKWYGCMNSHEYMQTVIEGAHITHTHTGAHTSTSRHRHTDTYIYAISPYN